jgi:hypothetical protein
MQGSNSSQDTDCPNWDIFYLLVVPPEKWFNNASIQVTTASFYMLYKSLFTFIQSFNATESDLMTVSSNIKKVKLSV